MLCLHSYVLTDIAALFVLTCCVAWRKPLALSVSIPCLPWERSHDGRTCLELQNAFQSWKNLLSSVQSAPLWTEAEAQRASHVWGWEHQGAPAGREGGILSLSPSGELGALGQPLATLVMDASRTSCPPF